jgi:hypothetical protein
VKFTVSRVDGPSGVADGYSDEDLHITFDEWHRAFGDAGYAVLFDEIEVHDAEIAYLSADHRSTGQVSLRDDCSDPDRLFVHVTDRPT